MADITAGVVTDTAVVLIVNVAVFFPDAIVTDVGTMPALTLLFNKIFAPVDGAGPLIITVPVAVKPPTTALGATTTDVSAGGVTVNVAVSTTPLRLAEISTLA